VLQTAYGQIDATLLSLFAGEHVVGWFGAAAQITNVLVVIPGAIITVALPVLSGQFVRSAEEFDQTASRTLLTTLLVMAPLGAGVAVSAPDILRILPYPVQFLNAVPVLSLLGIAVPVTAVLMVLATLAVAIGQEKQWLKISVFAVCIFPPLYTGLIWLFQTRTGNGAIGAAAANLIGETALLVWAWIVLPGRVKQADVVRRGLQVGALALIMVGAVVALRSLGVHLIVYVPIAAAIYFAGAWALKLVTANDVQVVRDALGRRRRAQAATS
jgi:O-antigen/teichoic acid export membrane protein